MTKIKTTLIIIGIVQVLLFAVFAFLMTTIDPKNVKTKTHKPVISLLRAVSENETFDQSTETTSQPEDYTIYSVIATHPKSTSLKPIVEKPEDNDGNKPKPEIYSEHRLEPKKYTVTFISLKNVAKNPELLRKGQTEMCNNTKCAYRWTIAGEKLTDNAKKRRRDISDGSLRCSESRNGSVSMRTSCHTDAPGSNPSKEFERTLKATKHEADRDAVQLRFLGFNHDGSPLVEIKVGSNLIVTNPMTCGDTSIAKWLPYIKAIGRSNNSCICKNTKITELQNKNENLRSKVSNGTHVTKTLLNVNVQRNKNETGRKRYFKAAKQKTTKKIQKEIVSANMNKSMVNASAKVVKDIMNSHKDEPLTIIDTQYERDFGGRLENLGTNIEMFFGNGDPFETVLHSTESYTKPTKLTKLADNVTESTYNHTIFTQNNTGSIKYVPRLIIKNIVNRSLNKTRAVAFLKKK